MAVQRSKNGKELKNGDNVVAVDEAGKVITGQVMSVTDAGFVMVMTRPAEYANVKAGNVLHQKDAIDIVNAPPVVVHVPTPEPHRPVPHGQHIVTGKIN
jgi:hypothetical protein